MTAVPESLVVLVADDDTNEITLIRRAFVRLRSISRVIAVSDGDVVIEYLMGKGRFADRTAWPIPRMLVVEQWMQNLSGVDVLRWVRSDPAWQSIPAILLTDSPSSAPTDLETKLRAASCVRAVNTRAFVQALDKAASVALRLAWQPTPLVVEPWRSRAERPSLVLHARPECV